jgi:hypothetical protein
MDSVILPAYTSESIIVKNSGANDCAVFPPAGAAIDAKGADNAYPIASGSIQEFVRISATQWYAKNKGTRYVPSTYVSFLDHTNATMDGTWVDLDISSAIPPSGRNLAGLSVYMNDNTAAAYISFKAKNGSVGSFSPTVPIANGYGRYYVMVPTDVNGVIQYNASTAMTALTVGTLGYWVEG